MKNIRDAAQQYALLRTALHAFKQWCTNIIQLNRPRALQLQRAATWKGTRAEVCRFLGWCFKFGEVQQPRMHHFLNGHLVCQFVSFLRARGLVRSNLVSFVSTTMRVVTWLQVTHQLSPLDNSRLEVYWTWLQNLHGQLSHHISIQPPLSMTQLIQQGRWMQPEELMSCISKAYAKAEAVVRAAALRAFAPDSLERPQVVLVQETLLCCLFFGYLPPLRPSVAISLQKPSYAGELCSV